jgi:hypothetical protein
MCNSVSPSAVPCRRTAALRAFVAHLRYRAELCVHRTSTILPLHQNSTLTSFGMHLVVDHLALMQINEHTSGQCHRCAHMA